MSSDKEVPKKSLGAMPSFRKSSAKKSDAATAKSAAAEDKEANKDDNKTQKSNEDNNNAATNDEAADDKTTEKPAKKPETRGRKRKAEADPEAEKTTPAKKSKTTKKAANETEKTPKKSPKGGKTQKGAKKGHEDDGKLKQSKINFSKRKSPNKKKDDDAMDTEDKSDKDADRMSDVDDSVDDNDFHLEKEESDEEIGSAEEEAEQLEPVEEPTTKNRKAKEAESEVVPEEDFVAETETDTPKKKETRGRPKKGEVRIPKKYVKKGRQPKTPKVWTPDNHSKEMGNIREEMKKSFDVHKFLFEKWMPNADELKEAIISDAKEYFPETKQSPQFCYRTEKSESEPRTLELFEVVERVKRDANHKDLMINVGGPVWAMDWCPRSTTDDEEQYIAVSAYNSDEYHVFSKPYSGKHIIQIWSLGKLNKAGAPSKPYLALGIAHEGGFVWDLQWCPQGSPLKQKVSGKTVPRLGLLASACGDGILRVYAVPDPEHLPKELSKPGSPVILKLKPVYEVSLPFPSLIWRCAWNQTCDMIATGCTDGTVAVFKPSDKESKVVTNTIPPPLKPPTVNFETCLGTKDVKDEPDEVTLSNMNTVSFLNSRKTQLHKIPIAYFTAHRTCALVQWSSEGAPKNLLVSMGDSIKFWDLRNTSCPLQQHTFGTKIANSITFGSQLSTVTATFDDGSVRYLDATGMNRQFVYHGASIWNGSSSPLVEHFATCDANGVVKTMPTNDCIKHSRLAASAFPRPTTIERMLYEDSILKFADSQKLAKGEHDPLNELTGNDEESEEEEKPKKKSKAKGKKKKDTDNDDEEDKDENNNNNTNEDNATKKPKKQLLDPMRAFHRVQWNPNFSACMWIAYAGKAGLLRCQAIDWVV
eukprot:TRINITY_DN2350_c0_g1_i2.p1 TRINITY_DN2350_c0_g1~~TRINITY_DN2350_c0_g1_i2.p1  ORF type:complete len:872 (+),score=195.86 TRINITY_DN2350_c0_g1_i2:48-2663(+)